MRWRAAVLAGAALVAAGCSNGAGATGPTGTVTGSYIRAGGPSGAPNVGLPGTISFRAGNGSLINFAADSAGKFSGQLHGRHIHGDRGVQLDQRRQRVVLGAADHASAAPARR